jgi:SsrA-binding protein
MYFLDGRAKVELALARGKRTYDKRRAIADRESKVRLRRVLKRRARETGQP